MNAVTTGCRPPVRRRVADPGQYRTDRVPGYRGAGPRSTEDLVRTTTGRPPDDLPPHRLRDVGGIPQRAEDIARSYKVFNDIGALELVTLVILAVLVFGPDKLPKVVQDVGRTIRKFREYSENAKQDIRRELGPEFKDFEFEDLNPKTFIRKHLDDDDLGLKEIRSSFDLKKEMTDVADAVHGRDGDTSGGSETSDSSSPKRVDMTKKPEAPAVRDYPPFDVDAT